MDAVNNRPRVCGALFCQAQLFFFKRVLAI